LKFISAREVILAARCFVEQFGVRNQGDRVAKIYWERCHRIGDSQKIKESATQLTLIANVPTSIATLLFQH